MYTVNYYLIFLNKISNVSDLNKMKTSTKQCIIFLKISFAFYFLCANTLGHDDMTDQFNAN